MVHRGAPWCDMVHMVVLWVNVVQYAYGAPAPGRVVELAFTGYTGLRSKYSKAPVDASVFPLD